MEMDGATESDLELNWRSNGINDVDGLDIEDDALSVTGISYLLSA